MGRVTAYSGILIEMVEEDLVFVSH